MIKIGKLKDELLNTELEQWHIDIPLLDYIYVIPTKRKHDSGYMQMEIVGENVKGYKKKLATYSDIFDIGEIFTNRHQYNTLSIDIPEYGILRIFSHQNKFKVKHYEISCFEIDIIEGKND